jgi:hypothetical protein
MNLLGLDGPVGSYRFHNSGHIQNLHRRQRLICMPALTSRILVRSRLISLALSLTSTDHPGVPACASQPRERAVRKFHNKCLISFLFSVCQILPVLGPLQTQWGRTRTTL